MRPRIDIDACSESCTGGAIASVRPSTRIPVYRGDVDNIVGVVFSKDLLDFVALHSDDKQSWVPQVCTRMPLHWTIRVLFRPRQSPLL